MKITMLPILKSIMEIMTNFKSLCGFGGRCLKIRDVCMDFEPHLKVHTCNLVSVYPKSIIVLGQMTNLNMIFHVVVSVYRLVKIWNSPQFPDEFRNGQFKIVSSWQLTITGQLLRVVTWINMETVLAFLRVAKIESKGKFKQYELRYEP